MWLSRNFISNGLKLAYLIFATSEQLSVNRQAVKIIIQEAVHGAEVLVSRLKSLRNESEFHSFYEKCVTLAFAAYI